MIFFFIARKASVEINRLPRTIAICRPAVVWIGITA